MREVLISAGPSRRMCIEKEAYGQPMVKGKVGGPAGCRCKTQGTTITARHPSHHTEQFTIDKLAVIE